MKKNTIAAQLYTLRDFLKTPKDVEKSLGRVKDIGYSAVQISGMGLVEPVYLKELLDSLGITCCATHISYDRLQKDLPAVVKEHQLWQCEYVGIGSMPGEYQRNRDGYARFAADASAVGRELARNGLKLIYHNHHFEFEKFDGVTAMDILMTESDPEALGFEIDTYWVQAGGANPVQWLKKAAGRLDVVHFKDMAIVDNQQVMAEIGEGNLDWPAIIGVCREIGVKWYAVEQDVCKRDPFESLAMSLAYLKKQI